LRQALTPHSSAGQIAAPRWETVCFSSWSGYQEAVSATKGGLKMYIGGGVLLLILVILLIVFLL
jgi:hypothetical protein